MDKKLNFTDISDFFAKAVGVSAAEGEAFVHTFFDTIVEGLEKDGIVKINGLGTFKVVEVESRSSVNINTGERFEINGHKRLTFIPSDSLKETINAPFAMFEPVEVDEDIDDEEEEEENDGKDISAGTIIEETSAAEENIEEETAIVEEIATEQPETIEENTVEDTPIDEEIATEQHEAVEEVVVVVSEIEEEMPQEIATEENSVASANIDEEMPIEESDYVPENNITEKPEEQIEAEVEIPSEEPAVTDEAEIAEESAGINEQEENCEETVTVEVAVPAAEETPKKEIRIPEKNEKEIFYHTLSHKKKQDKGSKVAILFALIIACIAGAFIGLHFYKQNITPTNNIKEQIAVTETVKSEEVNVTENIDSTEVDSVAVASDSIVVIATDSAVVAANDSVKAIKEEIIAKADTVAKDTIVPVIQPKEEKPVTKPAESFKVVDALARRELSTIFVADTTDYRIAGTICTHKVKSEETLIRISQKYYGDKRLWPYIVKYNNMIRPNDLACDMLLKIPRLVPKK